MILACVGFPLGASVRAGSYDGGARTDGDGVERVCVLVRTYEAEFWYMGSVSLLNKFVFAGAIHNILPESRFQVWIGTVLCLFVYVVEQCRHYYEE